MDIVVLKVESSRIAWAKEPSSPVLLKLYFTEPLAPQQLRHLLMAGVATPIACKATVGGYDVDKGAFEAELYEISVPMRPPKPFVPRRKGFGKPLPVSRLLNSK